MRAPRAASGAGDHHHLVEQSGHHVALIRLKPLYPASAASAQMSLYTLNPPMNNMNTRGLPGTFAPMYQELALGNSVASARWAHSATQLSTASGVASMAAQPCSSRYVMASAIQFTCASACKTMLASTAGAPGPDTRNKLGSRRTPGQSKVGGRRPRPPAASRPRGP